ncbi:MAG: hypothetical protein R3E12_01730 [Candidatus Eisenbacteria bacterium]
MSRSRSSFPGVIHGHALGDRPSCNGHRASPVRRALLPWILLILAGTLSACSDSPRSVTDDGHGYEGPTVTGIVLRDEFGEMVRATEDGLVGGIYLLDGETLSADVRLVTADGEIDPAELAPSVDLGVLQDESSVAVSMDAGSARILFHASASTNASFQIYASFGAETVYQSPPLPVLVNAPGEPVAIALLDAHGDPIADGDPLRVHVDDPAQTVGLEFRDAEGVAIPPARLGRHARIEVASENPEVVVASPSPGDPLAFQLQPVREGRAHLLIELYRDQTLLLGSDRFVVDVSFIADWTGFPPGAGPNGVVWDLETSPRGLLVAGEFSKVGDVVADGVARWNGTRWEALGPGPGPVRHLITDGAQLVVSTLAGGFYEWTGTGWEFLRDGEPGEPGVLHEGELVLARDLPEWEPSLPYFDCERGGMLTEYDGAPYWAIWCFVRSPMLQEAAVITRYRDGAWEEEISIYPLISDMCGVEIVSLLSQPGKLFYQWSDSCPWGTGWSARLRAGDHVAEVGLDLGTDYYDSWEGRSRNVRGFDTGSDRSLYLANQWTLWRDEVDGPAPLGDIDGAEISSSIHDVEAWGNRIFIGGDFSRVEDVESPNLAAWRTRSIP